MPHMFQSFRNIASPIAGLSSRMRWLPRWLLVAAIPVFLVTGSLVWAFNSIGLYEGGFEKYRIARASGITPQDLRQVAFDIRSYFNSADEPLKIRTRIFGSERELFNEKEVHHMRDVKRLVWGVYAIFAAAVACLAILVGAGFYRNRSAYAPSLARGALWGGVLTVGLLVVFGLIATVGFDAMFLLFHRISFANDFWQAWTRGRTTLCCCSRRAFWFDATMWVALRALAGGTLLAAAGGSFLAWRRWGAGGGWLSRIPGATEEVNAYGQGRS